MGLERGAPHSRGSAVRDWLDRRLSWLSSAPRRRELERARRSADAELLHVPAVPPRLAWRAAELTAGAHRLELADELHRVVHAADARYLPTAAPIARLEVRAETGTLLALAARLADLGRPVSPQGVLVVERLLDDSSGPLYRGERRTDELATALAEAKRALEAPS